MSGKSGSARTAAPTRASPAASRKRAGTPPRGGVVQHFQRTLGNLGTQQLLRRANGTAPAQRALSFVRAKLTVGPAGDAYEREAESAATRVVAGKPANAHLRLAPAASSPRQPEPEEPETREVSLARRLCTECKKEKRTQRRAAGPGEVDTEEAARAMATTGSGRSLATAQRADMERSFGESFAGVRVHSDTPAQRAAAALEARAFTSGRDIYLGAGETATDQSLMAHELTHVVQQNAGSPLPAASQRIAQREDGPPVNPVLSHEEMFQIITRERAWTYNPGGAVCEDPQGVGRGVGPAAGGRRAGNAVFAVIQVTDANGRPVALTYGEHLRYGAPHAEEGAVRALQREIPAQRDVSGGTMSVVLDQVPCPPGRRDCMGLLRGYARSRGLRLDIRLPTRPSLTGGGPVAPRTAAMSSQRTDVGPVALVPYNAGAGGGGPAGGGQGPHSGGPVGGPGGLAGPAPGAALAPPRLVAPPPAAVTLARQRTALIAQLGRETRRSVQIASRINLAMRGLSGIMSVLGAINQIRTAQQIATRGTLFGDAEERAGAIRRGGEAIRDWAIETTGSISFIEATVQVADAIERGDSDVLFELSGAYGDLGMELGERSSQLPAIARDLRAREAALRVLAEFYETLMRVPQPGGSAPQADAFAMYLSCDRLAGRMGSAAQPYEEAELQLRWHAEWLQGLAFRANREAWRIVLGRIAFAMGELDRQAALDERLRRERRMNQIQGEIEAIDAELNQPVCVPEGQHNELHARRAALVTERDALRAL